MRLRTLYTASVLALGLAAPAAHAQSVGRMLETDFRNLFTDMWAIWVSPVNGSARDWGLAAATIAASGVVSVIDDDIDRWALRNRDAGALKVVAWPAVREGGVLYAGNRIAPVAGGLYIVALATKNRDLRDGMFGCLSAYTGTSVLRNQVLYRLVGRERPDSSRDNVDSPPAQQGDQYNFELGDGGWGMHSMPAGHAMNIAACASFLNNRFNMGAAEPVLYLYAIAVGTGRILDRRHWTSDTMLGLVMGYAAGKLVAQRSLERLDEDRARRMGTPVPAATGTGFYITPGRDGMRMGWQAVF